MNARAWGETPRYAPGGYTTDGVVGFNWALTDCSLTDPVHLVIPPKNVLPVVFVPGIMGSNLRTTSDDHKPVWRLDELHGWERPLFNHGPVKNKPVGLVLAMASLTPGQRQKIMHPDRVEVDPDGYVPDKTVGSVTSVADYIHRGWGEVSESSYKEFLLWLEDTLNGQGYNPAEWDHFSNIAVRPMPKPGEPQPSPKLYPGTNMHMAGLPATGEVDKFVRPVTSDELLKRAGYRMPVYACGYNWLENNVTSAERLQQRIDEIIREHNTSYSRCEQVIIVTHSMGGLVARACQKLPGMQEKIAGTVHGVMPTTGAAVAYRRCKVGMRDEDYAAGLAIGETGQTVTAVFAQAPGALELLPTAEYKSPWLTFTDASGNSLSQAEPTLNDPYADIYLNNKEWWGLVRPEWLSPKEGAPITWDVYEGNVNKARNFAGALRDSFHPTTYVFYGNDPEQKSFEGTRWEIKAGRVEPHQGRRPDISVVPGQSFTEARSNGNNPVHVGGEQKTIQMARGPSIDYNTSFWDIYCSGQDSGGDGTVPIISGAAPKVLGGSAIKQQFGLRDFEHEGAYRDPTAQLVSLYSIVKIAANAKVLD